MGIVTGLSVTGINEIMLLTQPGHLQKMTKRVVGPDDRDMQRASMIRERLKQVSVVG